MTCVKKNPTRFYYKEIIEQGYDKKMYPKLMLKKLKVMANSTSIYTPWAPNFKKYFKKFPMYTCGPYSPMCANVHPCVNYEWTKIQLKVN
jgi:hypothetical protein